MSSTIKVEIDTKTYIRFLLVVSLFAIVVFLAWKLLPILLILAISFFLAIALNKPVQGLARRLPGRSRVFATALVYTAFVVALGLFFSIVVPPAVKQTMTFITSLPDYVTQLSKNGGFAANIIDRYHLQNEVDAFVRGLQNQAGSFAQGIGANVVSGVSTLLTGFVTLITILVLTFLMLIEGPKWQEELWNTYTSSALLKRHQQLAHKMYHVITGYVNGQVLVASIAAALAGLVMFVLSVFFPVPLAVVLPLAVITLCFELIPLVGPTIGLAIVVSVLAFNDLGAALVYLVYFVIYMQIEANIVQPAVQSRTVDISALTVFVAVITGVVLLGIAGGILAIPVAGCLRVLVLDFIEERHNERLRRQRIAKANA